MFTAQKMSLHDVDLVEIDISDITKYPVMVPVDCSVIQLKLNSSHVPDY